MSCPFRRAATRRHAPPRAATRRRARVGGGQGVRPACTHATLACAWQVGKIFHHGRFRGDFMGGTQSDEIVSEMLEQRDTASSAPPLPPATHLPLA